MIARNLQNDGSNIRDLDVDQPIINIGSHPENDIVITGEGILPFHAMVLLRDGIFHLTGLAPEARVLMDGAPIQEETITFSERSAITIGTYTVSIMHNHLPTGMHATVTANSAGTVTAPAVAANMDKSILVNILSQHTEIQIAQSAVYELELVNAGQIVAGFSVSLQGIPTDWVEINPKVFNLNEHQRATVTITVTPPRDPASTAGKHSLHAIISSPNYPGAQAAVPLNLFIEPYYEFSLGNLTPKQQNIPWRKQSGKARLPITNRGNGPADFSVLAYDDENGCSFDFRVRDDLELSRQATINVQAGSTLELPIEITPLKRHVFAMRSKRYQYTTTVNVAQNASAQQVVSGSVTSFPLFGWWSIVLSVMLVLLGLFILVQPRIQSFDVAANKDVIELGDTTKLEWQVSPFATRVNISNVDETISYGQNSLTVAPKQSTTYELVAGNWLSGLLGLDQKKVQTVLVVPPVPTVNVFEVDNTLVARGEPVSLRWSVTQADKAVLTIGGVVYELSPEKFSGEQSVVLDKDSLVTLDASNASGSELRSYYINVTDPHITINSFIIWVRPQAGASVKQDQPVLAAMRLNPLMGFSMLKRSALADDDFTEPYVELVRDSSSEQGYSVKFYQPKRELDKGEQVMVEWDVEGTNDNTVQIAPFTDALPSKGRQPYFPQASMNFVLTAQSGDQKNLFMLPVTVFDGTPPTAPKIDIFRASPMSTQGPGKVQFTWSISGEWTRIELSSGNSGTLKNLMPEGFKSITVSYSDTFVLKAWNGTLSSSQAIDITVNPAPQPVNLIITSIQEDKDSYNVGDTVTVFIALQNPNDKSIPLHPLPTGEITVFSEGDDPCFISLPSKSSCEMTFITPGDKNIQATFQGDSHYRPADSDPRPIIVKPNPPILNADVQISKNSALSEWVTTTKGTNVGTFYVGEVYRLTVTVSNMPSNVKPTTNDLVIVEWPSEFDGVLQTGENTTCVRSVQGIRLLLTKDWIFSCNFVFANSLDTVSLPTLTFTLSSQRFHATPVILTLPQPSDPVITKRTPSVAINITAGVPVLGMTNTWYALSDPKATVEVKSTHYQITSTNPNNSRLMMTLNGITSSCPNPDPTQYDKYICDIPDNYSGDVTLAFSYDENSVFASLNPSPTIVTLLPIPVDIGTPTYDLNFPYNIVLPSRELIPPYMRCVNCGSSAKYYFWYPYLRILVPYSTPDFYTGQITDGAINFEFIGTTKSYISNWSIVNATNPMGIGPAWDDPTTNPPTNHPPIGNYSGIRIYYDPTYGSPTNSPFTTGTDFRFNYPLHLRKIAYITSAPAISSGAGYGLDFINRVTPNQCYGFLLDDLDTALQHCEWGDLSCWNGTYNVSALTNSYMSLGCIDKGPSRTNWTIWYINTFLNDHPRYQAWILNNEYIGWYITPSDFDYKDK